MKKKLLYLLLTSAMCVSLTACGGGNASEPSSAASGGASDSSPASAAEDESDPDMLEPTSAEGDYYTNYSILADGVDVYEAYSAAELAGTIWVFAGGYIDGQEMDDEAATAVLEMYGGTMQIEFPDTETANLVQGGGTMPGAFIVLDDGATVNFSFELEGNLYDYVAVFTSVSDEGDPAMVLVSTADPESALYLTPVLAD